MALDFAGVATDYVQIANHATLNIGAGNFTYCCWAYIDALVDYGKLLFGDGDGTSYFYVYFETDDKIYILSKDDANNLITTTGVAPGTGAWAHWTAIRLGTSVYLYKNNVQIATGTNASYGTCTLTGGSAWQIGILHDGRIEDPRMYQRALTAEERAILAAGYRGPLGGEICWLDFQSARGAYAGALTQGTHLLPDLSVNSNDGDPYGDVPLVESDCPRYGSGIFIVGRFELFPSLAGAITFAGAVATAKSILWELFARFHDYLFTAPQKFTISSNSVQLTARYRDYYFTAPEKRG